MKPRLNDKCVYWAPSGFDDEGRPTFAAPVEFSCRWDDAVEETVDKDNQLTYTTSTVILWDNEVKVGGVLYKGQLADIQASGSVFPVNDPMASKEAREIVSRKGNKRLRGGETIWQAFLK